MRIRGFLFLSLFLLVQLSFASKINPKQLSASSLSRFGFELFDELKKQESQGPVAISPMSIGEAVTLAAHGAQGETLTQMESLFLTDSDRKLGANLSALAIGIQGIREDLKAYSKASDGIFEYKSANSLWANSNPQIQFQFKSDFKKIAEESYGATVRERDFAAVEDDKTQGKLIQKTVREVNDWVSGQTEEKITRLISKLNPDDVALVMNAIYSKGKFKNHFSDIETGDYRQSDGQVTQASFMRKKDEGVLYYKDQDLTAMSFPIGISDPTVSLKDEVALDILVPADGDIASLAKYLAQNDYTKLVSSMKYQNVDLTVVAGKVEQENAVQLKKVLVENPFTIPLPFSARDADFGLLGTVLGDGNLYINDIITKTFYEMTPFGFEAAAATAVIFAVETTVAEPPQFIEEKVDSPSLHVVRHIATGLPLFIIEYDSPKLYNEEELVALVEQGHQANRNLNAKVDGGRIGVSYQDNKLVIGLIDDQGKVQKVLKDLN